MKRPMGYFPGLLPTAFVMGNIVLSTLLGLWEETACTTNPSSKPACLQSTAVPLCYSPEQMRQAYGVQPLLDSAITGKGQTIALIENSPSPTIQTDLHLFDQTFGLPDPQLKVIAPFGTPLPLSNKPETALDVEWAHVMAPEAAIQVIQADDTGVPSFLQVIQFAVQYHIGDVISISLVESEQCFGTKYIQQAHAIFQQARDQRQTVLASTGDTGATVAECDADGHVVSSRQGVNYPASDPLVTSVGGTTLLTGRSGTNLSETVWNEADKGGGTTGGGFSSVFPKPDFQQYLPGTKRGVADLSFDADQSTGVPIVTTSVTSGTTQVVSVGGTSLGAPAVAGIVALFNQFITPRRVGFLNDALYRISQNAGAYTQAFHDVRSDNNPFVFKNATGWNLPTGVGTPNAAKLAVILPQFIRPNDGSTL